MTTLLHVESTKAVAAVRGRPPKGDDKRTARLELRLSPTEAAAVEAGAAAAGVRVADFVRRAALGLAAGYEVGKPR